MNMACIHRYRLRFGRIFLALTIVSIFIIDLEGGFSTSSNQQAWAQSKVSYGPYWIGMSYADFERSPVPDKWSPTQVIPPRVSVQRDADTNSISCTFGPLASFPPYKRGSPTFLFFKNDPASDYKLVTIFGSMNTNDVDTIAKILRSSIGAAKIWQPLDIHGRFRYEWQVGSTFVRLLPQSGPFASLQYINDVSYTKYKVLSTRRDEAKRQKEQQESAARTEAEDNEYQMSLVAMQNQKDQTMKLIDEWIQAAQMRAGNDAACRSVDSKYSDAIRNQPQPKIERRFVGGSFFNQTDMHKEGVECLKSGKTEQAITLLTQIYSADPQNSSYALDLADAERVAGKIDLAKRHYMEAISLGVGYQAWLGLGIVLAESGQHANAVTCFLLANRHSSGTGIDGVNSEPSMKVREAYLDAMSQIWPSQNYGTQLNRLRTKRANNPATESEDGIIGFMFRTRRGQLPVVDKVVPGFGASDAGIVAGDELAEIDGKSTIGLSQEEIRDLSVGKVGTVARIKLSNGVTVQCIRKSPRGVNR